MEAIPVANC